MRTHTRRHTSRHTHAYRAPLFISWNFFKVGWQDKLTLPVVLDIKSDASYLSCCLIFRESAYTTQLLSMSPFIYFFIDSIFFVLMPHLIALYDLYLNMLSSTMPAQLHVEVTRSFDCIFVIWSVYGWAELWEKSSAPFDWTWKTNKR